jgi:hypothetical protein
MEDDFGNMSGIVEEKSESGEYFGKSSEKPMKGKLNESVRSDKDEFFDIEYEY